MIKELKTQLQQYFVGKEDVVDNLLVCLLAKGHILLEDVPGVGKTTLARILAKSVNCDFGRIQFTPDTLPSDVTGVEILNVKTGEFEYREGAVMHQIVLADEINRTSPKTQASLLEAMSESQVTVGNERYEMKKPFMVIATQNPVEFVGTYPLPEAQMDRFMMKLSLGYPAKDEELRMARNILEGKDADSVCHILNGEDVCRMQAEVEKIEIAQNVLEYIQEIVALTREEENFALGASPRALISLMKGAQAKAYMEGRDFVIPDDVKAIAIPVLHHRIVLTTEAKIRKENIDKLLKAIIVRAKIPMAS